MSRNFPDSTVGDIRESSIRTVVVPHRLEPPLFRALLDVRRGVNRLVADWVAHPDESRFAATKRTYPLLRRSYAHLASSWPVVMANETSAVCNAWDRSLRRARRQDPVRYERMRHSRPNRRQLKASLHPSLFRWNSASSQLDITVRPSEHVRIELADGKNPLFWKYGSLAEWRFGLTLRPTALLFHFRVPRVVEESEGAVGADLNFDSADLAASTGAFARVDLRPITRLQERMVHKRQSIARHISKDLRHQRAVLRRYHRRETRRVTPLLHRAGNELLANAGSRAIVLEDLTDLTQTILRGGSGPRRPRGRSGRRRLSAWTHGRLAEIVTYKAHTPVIRVNSEGTSQECPRCGGPLALPSERRVVGSAGRTRMTRQVTCEQCGGAWHRDAAAAIAVLARGCRILRGTTITPSARSALLEAATWRSDSEDRFGGPPSPSLPVEPRREDDAKSEDRPRFPDR